MAQLRRGKQTCLNINPENRPTRRTIMSLAPIKRRDRFAGLLLGTALGDSLGYPAEGLAPQRIKKLYKAGWQHRFIFGYGLVSDDTDHTVFVA